MATVYGSYISSAFRSRADISTSQTDTQVTISVTGYCQMADYYHDSGENFFRKIVIGSDTPNKYVTASTAYFSGGGTYGVGSSSRTYNRTHAAQSIEVGVAIHNDGVYTGWSTADSYAKTTVTVPAKPSYAVTYNANGGSSTPSSQTKWYGESLTLASAISRSNASATGYKVTYDANGGSCSTTSATAARTTKYTFSKWNTKSDGSGTAYAAGASYTGNSALALYATWTSSTTTSAVTLPTPSRTGYAFDGWYTAASGGTRVGGAGGSYTPTGAVTLHAHWTQNTWTVSYNANGGSSTPASQTKLYGQALTLRGAISRSNATATYTVSYSANYSGGTNPSSGTATKTTKYAFNGWKATNGTTYAASGSYTANAATTMTAQWTSSASTTSVTLPTPTRTGYTFGGWYKESSCTNKVGNGGASYTPTASVTLYAHWTVITYTVAYNANNGSGAPSSQTKTYGVTLTLSSTKPTRTGYTFSGWNTKDDGSGTSYAAGANYTANAAATLYAQWTIITYTVSYNANGGSGAPSSQTKTYGKTLTLSSTKPTRSGYEFWHWNTKSDNSGTTYAAGASYTANAAATLYAIWNPIISYNANGGSGAPASQTKTYGVTLTLSSTTPTRSGYVFWHWNTKADNTGTTYAAGANYTANAAATLYAIWNPIISYNANGGTGAPASQTKTYGTDLTLSSTIPTRTNLTFAGWGTSSTATTVSYAAGAKYTSNTAATLYAIWKYTVNFNGNGNGVNPTAQTAVYGYNVTIAGYPTRSGYRFIGWNSVQDGTGTHYAPGVSVAVNENCTLYAQWRKVTVSSVKVTRNVRAIGFTSTWSCSSTVGGTVTVTAQYSLDDGESWHDCTLTGDATKPKVAGTDLSGTVTWESTADEDVAVRVMVTVKFTDTYSSTSISGGHDETAQRGGTIPKEFRLFDALHGGTGLAIGAIATLANTFEVALTTLFQNVVEVAQGNITRDGTYTEPANGDHQIRFVDSSRRILSYLSAHKTGNSPNNYLRLSVYGPSGSKTASLYISASDTAGYLSTDVDVMTLKSLKAMARGISYIQGANGNAALYAPKSTTNQYYPAVCLDTNGGGSWSIGNYDDEALEFVYATKANRDSNTNTVSKMKLLSGNGTIYTTTNKPSATDVGALPITGGSSAPMTGSIYQNASGRGYFLKDSAGNSYPGVYDNGSNLWLGSTATASTHHKGQTYISAGHNGTSGNATIYVCVPNAANNGGTNYGVYHTGNKPTPADIGAQAAGSYVTRNVDSAWINNSGGTAQLWNVGAVVKNANNKTYSGHSASLIVQNGGISLYDGTTSTWVWDAYTTLNKPTPAAIGAQPAGSYATTTASGAINTLAYTSTQQWYVKGTVSNSSNTARNGHTTWLTMNNGSCSCWDATAGAMLWNAYTTANKPTPADIGAIDDITTSSKTVSLPANSGSVSVTAPSVSGYTFVCWLQVAGSGHTNPGYMQDPKSSTTNLWSAVGTTTGARNWLVTALYKK